MRATVLVLALPLLLAGCYGDAGRYARYQHKGAAIRKIDALVATIPQYRGARLAMRQDFSTSYKLAYDSYIDAEPYSSALYYDLPPSVTGAELQRYFRAVMRARGWTCRFAHRSSGVPYGFACTRRGDEVGAHIADSGTYELDVAVKTARPPIPTVEGD
jgi:hypothetical protein